MINTPGRRQSKTLSTINERGSKIVRNCAFDCHLSPVWRQMAIKNSVSNDFLSTFLDNIGVFYCRLPGVINETRTIFQCHTCCWRQYQSVAHFVRWHYIQQGAEWSGHICLSHEWKKICPLQSLFNKIDFWEENNLLLLWCVYLWFQHFLMPRALKKLRGILIWLMHPFVCVCVCSK